MGNPQRCVAGHPSSEIRVAVANTSVGRLGSNRRYPLYGKENILVAAFCLARSMVQGDLGPPCAPAPGTFGYSCAYPQ
jgi:hypothetical protein